jgi:hypothetical protein
MQIDLNNLPTDTALLHRLMRDISATIEYRDGEIERQSALRAIWWRHYQSLVALRYDVHCAWINAAACHKSVG